LRKLPRDFYERDTLLVAQDLLGKLLVHEAEDGKTIGKIVEVEAYLGPEDKAAHSYQGLNSTRTRIMYPLPHILILILLKFRPVPFYLDYFTTSRANPNFPGKHDP
jgi:DNA-3-methyladenine glycosylase